MKNIGSGIRLSDDKNIDSRNERYSATIETRGNETTVKLADSKKQLDQKLVITALDDRCFTFILTVTNTGSEPLALKDIFPIEGTLSEKHNPELPHILLNGSSMSKPHPTVLPSGQKPIKSTETIALESPSLAAGYLTGKHNVNRFTVTDMDKQPVFRAHGDCDGCLINPGASRETDLLFVSLHNNPLQQLERYADLAGKITMRKYGRPA